MISKTAIILAGGRGTRLRPYTVVLPKPLMPIGDHPVLEVIVRQLAAYGFERIWMAVNHQADIITAYFGDGRKWGLKVGYSLETVPLGTMGPLRLMPDLPEHFLIMNGDILTNFNYANFLSEHIKENALFTVSAARRSQLIDYGVLETSAEGVLTGFQEKPRVDYLVSMGIYAASRQILEHIPDGTHFGFDNLILALCAKQLTVKAKPFDGYWLDIGRPDDYMKAIDDYEEMRHIFLPKTTVASR